MATVQSPLQSAAAKGSVGEVTYSVYRSTNVARKRSYPSQPRTIRQLQIRAFLTTSSRAWAALTANQRDAWGVYAMLHPSPDKFGNSRTVSGFDWYCATALLLLDLGKAVAGAPPIINPPGAVAALVLTPAAGAISFAFTAHAGTDTSIDIWLKGPHSVGRLPDLASAKHQTYAPGETTPKVVSGLAVGYYTAWVRFIDETTGLAGPWTKATATVAT